jgi:hypothetical protein
MRKGEKSKKMIKKYFIPIRGHKTVFAKSEKEAYKIVDKDLETTHQNFNLKTYVIR